MKVANFKKLFSIILSVLICITFIISIGNAGVSVEASTENVIKNDNVNDKYTQIKDSYQTNSSYYSVEDVVNELFNDLQIKDCNYLYNLDDRPDYIYVEFQEGGYAIFFKETMELLEYSAQGTLEYSNSNSIRYYGGPGSYLIKLNGECYINTITDEKTYIRKESAIEYCSIALFISII